MFEGIFTEEMIEEMIEQINNPEKRVPTVDEVILENDLVIAQRQMITRNFEDLGKKYKKS